MATSINEIGKIYSRLTVIRHAGTNSSGRTLWECKCECGNISIVPGKYLRNFHTKSCGCLSPDTTALRNLRHGKSQRGRRSSAYSVWCHMRGRCNNPDNKDYYLYGERGIKVCERWRHSFENLLADMSEKPSPKHSIERRNTNKDYEPENCYWATSLVQANNKRNNRKLTCFGKTMNAGQWAKEIGIHQATLLSRIDESGWSIKRALTEKVKCQVSYPNTEKDSTKP